MKSIYKLFVKIYPHILLIFSISLLSIDYYFYNFKNQIYTSSVLKIYPENNFGFFFFICLAFVLIDFKYKVFQKFIHLLKNLDKKIIIIIIVKIVLILSLFDIVFFRRALLFALFFPYIIYFFFRIYFSKKIKSKIFMYLCVLGLIIATFPGFYLHPFFSGIPGWGVNLSKSKYLSENRVYYKIYAINNGEKIEEYYSHALFNPITHFGRPLLNFRKRIIWNKYYGKNLDLSDYEKKICRALIDIYTDAHPYLKKGIFPYQKNFHDFSYPTHNMSNMYANYKNINPENIQKISFLQTHIKIDIEKEEIYKFKQTEIFKCSYD